MTVSNSNLPRAARYADVAPSAFGFTVSDRTKLFARVQSQRLAASAQRRLLELAGAVSAALTRQDYDPSDVPSTARRFQGDAEELQRAADLLANSSGVQDFAAHLAQDWRGLPGQPLALQVADDTHYLDVLQVVSDEPLVGREVLAQWARPLHQAAEELAARAGWHRFLVALHDRLIQYDVQVKYHYMYTKL